MFNGRIIDKYSHEMTDQPTGLLKPVGLICSFVFLNQKNIKDEKTIFSFCCDDLLCCICTG